jgi:hypothetical protein
MHIVIRYITTCCVVDRGDRVSLVGRCCLFQAPRVVVAGSGVTRMRNVSSRGNPVAYGIPRLFRRSSVWRIGIS